MNAVGKFAETWAQYRRHGWRLERVLMKEETLAELQGEASFEGVEVSAAEVDAMWLARASSGGREAWELRLVGEPYALFELFEPDEEEEDREDVRREMEARLREHVAPRPAGEEPQEETAEED